MRTKTCLKSATMSATLLFCVVHTLHAAEAPYGGTPATVPGTVLAENYDTGGQAVAYNVTSVNGTAAGNAYRSDGVDLETATAPATGDDLGWTASTQWFKYTVNVASAGIYKVSFLVAAPSAVTDAFHISNSSGTNLTGSVNIPATGGFQTWTTVTATVTLPAGTQTLTLNEDTAGWNIDTAVFALANAPYGGIAAAIPGTVKAENYDTGGQAVAYNVTSVNGTDNAYRTDGVDLETATAPATGNDLGWTASGQWFKYTVNVATAGTYTVSFLVTAPTAVTDAFHISNSSGTSLTGSVAVPATGGWQTWTTVTATVTLPAGTQTLALNQDTAGWNIDTATFTSTTVTVAATPTFSPAAGTYATAQTVTISDSTSGAKIYYTTNGTTPTTSSTVYSAPITVSATETLKAIAAATGFNNSAVGTAAYTISTSTAATPTFSPAAGTYTSAQTVTISDSTSGAKIYYTTNGTTPTTSSTLYSGPITVSGTESFEAIATATGDTNSAVATAAYTITTETLPTTSTPPVAYLTPPPAALQVNAGGSANGSWAADEYFSGGSTSSTTSGVNTLFDLNPAPQSVYQSERYGDFTYTMPGLTANAPYTVNLHFAEIAASSVGAREFNVLINGTEVLTNFDIFAATGGEYMAIEKSFLTTANSSGQIVIQFTTGAANNPKVSGIEILPVSTFLTSGGIYNIVSRASGLALDNQGSNTAAHAVWQWGAGTGNTNQQWQINMLPNGKYNLVNLTSGMALDNGGSTANGASILQNPSSITSVNQQWTITNLGSGDYQFVVASSGKALDNSGATANGGTVYQQPVASGDADQEWQLVPITIGATTPFVSYEAESGTLAGGATVVSLTSPPTTEFSSPQLEASGHAYVNLGATGQSVTWTNNTGKNITFFNLRYSIPDSSGGGGITSTLDLYVNGVFRQAIPVNSIQTWIYESSSNYNGNDQTPSSGTPHVFWDEEHAFITGAAITPGSTITLQKDSANSAAFYNIDVIDVENPPAPLTQPANSISITSCGAVADPNPTNGQANSGAVNSTTAIQNCINEAQTQGKILWIPQGTFYLIGTNGLTANGITIEGAGMWYSTIYRDVPLPNTPGLGATFQVTSCTMENLHIDANAKSRATVDGAGGAMDTTGTNWVANNMWNQHSESGCWASGTGGIIENSRFTSMWADGCNINNVALNATVGNNITERNNFVRGTGDDGIAINDGNGAQTSQEMQSPTVVNNTIIAPWWANNSGLYGGQNGLVANNLLMDSVKNRGIDIGPFSSSGNPIVSALVQGNLLLRTGSNGYGDQFPAIGAGTTPPLSSNTDVTIAGNGIISPMFDGVGVQYFNGGFIQNNTVNSPGFDNFHVDSNAEGSATFICNTALNTHAGESAYVNNGSASNITVSGSCNLGFTVP